MAHLPPGAQWRMLAEADVDLSTSSHRPDDQLEVWRQIVAETFTAARLDQPRPPESPGFLSRIQARRIGDLSLSWLSSSTQTLKRTADLIGRRPSEAYFLNLVTSGSGTVIQDGREAVVHSGQFVLVDSDRPFTLGFESDFSQFCLVLPKALIDPLLAAPQACTARPVDGGSLAGSVVTAAVQTMGMQRAPHPARETRMVVEHVIALVALAVSEAAAEPAYSSGQRLAQLIIDEIERGYTDPDLTPQLIAARISISVSYLVKLLARQGTSFRHLLLARRLDHAWERLDPHLWAADPVTITHVAHECGFRDSSHFARTFRARFGVTASERRAGARRASRV